MGTAPFGFHNEQLEMAYFMELQRRVFDVFRYVSCNQANFETYSVIIESVLIDAGSFFDSQCQTLVRHFASEGKHFKDEAEVRDFKRKADGKENFNFGDYRKLFESEFAISAMSVNLNKYDDAYFASPLRHMPDTIQGFTIAPFSAWAKPDGASFWWTAFTDLKHDRLSNFRSATLGAVVHAMAAVFIVLTIHNISTFKEGRVEPAVYDLFFPKYWESKGRIFPGIITWK